MTSDLRPKQQRSKSTHQKFVAALQHCLTEKFFEHISIKELADNAGVSVGTFYRRFKNKESLLPMLYDAFGEDLGDWVTALEQQTFIDLDDCIRKLCLQTLDFLQQHQSVFRTLHLNSRLHPESIAKPLLDRRATYQRMSKTVLKFEAQIMVNNKEQAVNMIIYIMINTLLDKLIYPNIPPAIACALPATDFADELPNMLLSYLRSNDNQGN